MTRIIKRAKKTLTTTRVRGQQAVRYRPVSEKATTIDKQDDVLRSAVHDHVDLKCLKAIDGNDFGFSVKKSEANSNVELLKDQLHVERSGEGSQLVGDHNFLMWQLSGFDNNGKFDGTPDAELHGSANPKAVAEVCKALTQPQHRMGGREHRGLPSIKQLAKRLVNAGAYDAEPDAVDVAQTRYVFERALKEANGSRGINVAGAEARAKEMRIISDMKWYELGCVWAEGTDDFDGLVGVGVSRDAKIEVKKVNKANKRRANGTGLFGKIGDMVDAGHRLAKKFDDESDDDAIAGFGRRARAAAAVTES